MFKNRKQAGRQLVELLRNTPDVCDAKILALPRGGVPVGYEIANALDLPLSIIVVRKLGVPFQPELAMGAVASGNITYLDPTIANSCHISEHQLKQIIERELCELSIREKRFHYDRNIAIRGNNIVLVDDGIATGSTMIAAINAIQTQAPKTISVAVPVAPRSIQEKLIGKVDHFYCLEMPDPFYAVGAHYQDFSQVVDDEVNLLLENKVVS